MCLIVSQPHRGIDNSTTHGFGFTGFFHASLERLVQRVHLFLIVKANVFGLGFANGIFAVAAVGAMLGLASKGKGDGEGARMGVWGAAQAIAFGLGGLSGAVLVDRLRGIMASDGAAFQAVFAIEALLFVAAALVATGTTLVRAPDAGTAKREALA